jgi:hypothetical protein
MAQGRVSVLDCAPRNPTPRTAQAVRVVNQLGQKNFQRVMVCIPSGVRLRRAQLFGSERRNLTNGQAAEGARCVIQSGSGLRDGLGTKSVVSQDMDRPGWFGLQRNCRTPNPTCGCYEKLRVMALPPSHRSKTTSPRFATRRTRRPANPQTPTSRSLPPSSPIVANTDMPL